MDGAHEVLGAGGIQRREPVGGSAKGIPRHMRSHCRRYRALALPSSQRWLGRCCFGESEGWPGIHVRVGVLRRPSLLTLRDAPLSVADGLSPAAGCVPRPLAECLAAAWWWLGPRSCIAGRSIAGSQCRRRARPAQIADAQTRTRHAIRLIRASPSFAHLDGCVWRSLTNSLFWRKFRNLQNKNSAAADIC
jgi:hypothetical protein